MLRRFKLRKSGLNSFKSCKTFFERGKVERRGNPSRPRRWASGSKAAPHPHKGAHSNSQGLASPHDLTHAAPGSPLRSSKLTPGSVPLSWLLLGASVKRVD